MLATIPEVYAMDMAARAKREGWPDGQFVAGIQSRIIENKDIVSTLIFDERWTYFLEGQPLKLKKWLVVHDADGCVRPYAPTQDDMHAEDWIIEDFQEVIDYDVRRKAEEAKH